MAPDTPDHAEPEVRIEGVGDAESVVVADDRYRDADGPWIGNRRARRRAQALATRGTGTPGVGHGARAQPTIGSTCHGCSSLMQRTSTS